MAAEPTESDKIALPFTNIAVSLSGGGYRATSFHLGSLSYLAHREHKGKTLLENVRILSTISGGTLTGVMYALKLAQGGTFSDCFAKLYELLSENRLVNLALEKLNKPHKWQNKHKTRDLINAFSEVYDKHFFDGATFETLGGIEQTHLKDVIFGSSEFTTGIQFRWHKTHDGGVFGNGHLFLPAAAASKVRLADAAAASSCFPGGFEPMIMPTDFGNGPGSVVEEAWFEQSIHDKQSPVTAIMDGGIVDNQGINGVKLAENRNSKGGTPYIGTFIVSDVSPATMDPYKVPELKYRGIKNIVTLHRINRLMITTSVLVIAALGIVQPSYWGVVSGTIWLTLAAIWLILYFVINRMIENQVASKFGTHRAPEIISHLRVLTRTPLYIVIYLIKFRITSVMKVASDIFLRRIRTLELNDLYSSRYWNYRVKGNNIYTLEQDLDDLPPAMRSVIREANSMPTTLWFAEADVKAKKLDNLIACGQLTMCSNLIRYIDTLRNGRYREKVWQQLDTTQQQELMSLHSSMWADWETFKKDPFWLLNQHRNTQTTK